MVGGDRRCASGRSESIGSHSSACSFGRCSSVSGASPEPDRSGQFLDQVLPVALGEADAADIVGPNCVVDVVVDVDQASAVCLAGLIVEVEAGVTTSVGDEPAVAGVAGRNSRHARKCSPFDGNKVEDVELAIRFGE